MKAIVIARPGGPEVLELRDAPAPIPAPREIRVRVSATAVNRADLMQREGRYPAPPGAPADIPGLEYAGVVESTGGEVSRWQTGDHVMGLVGGGSYAEMIVTHEDEAVRVPDDMPLLDAAALPEAFITAHDALFTRMLLRPGEDVLIHAVGSGVGTAALQLAKAHGARVLGTQRTAWKLDKAKDLGLDIAIDPAAEDFAELALRETDGRGVGGVIDLVGGNYLEGNLRAVTTLGRIVVVGLVAGAKATLDMRMLLNRRVTIIGTVLRARSLEEKIAAARAFERDVLPLIERGTVKPIIDEVIPLTEAARAHELVASNTTYGKVVLTL